MKQHLLIIATLIACLLPAVNFAESSQSIGVTSATNELTHIGTDKGFGAQLWIIEDQAFFKNWNKPSKGVRLPNVNRAKRGVPVFAIILFAGPGANEKNLCDVSYYLLITTPDGKKYGETLDGDCWKNLPPPAAGQIQLSSSYVGTRIEDKYPSGRYIVKAIVYDRVKDAKVELTQYFDVD
jgi:hypothetical protein